MNSAARLALRFSRFVILLHSQIPGELEPFEQLLGGRLRQSDVRRAQLAARMAGDDLAELLGKPDNDALRPADVG